MQLSVKEIVKTTWKLIPDEKEANDPDGVAMDALLDYRRELLAKLFNIKSIFRGDNELEAIAALLKKGNIPADDYYFDKEEDELFFWIGF